jgi:membrane protease YdiL (CAAX protease family)
MEPRRLLPIIAAGEGLMLVVAVGLAEWTGQPLRSGAPGPGIAWGIIAALALALINLGFLHARHNSWPGRSLRHVCRQIVRPLFEHVSAGHIAIVSILAGLGEELLFRGALQPLIGWFGASIVFGGVHVAGRGFIGYGLWAAFIGALFGGLMEWTGGLTAPVVAHAVYDAAALAYVRYGPKNVCGE